MNINCIIEIIKKREYDITYFKIVNTKTRKIIKCKFNKQSYYVGVGYKDFVSESVCFTGSYGFLTFMIMDIIAKKDVYYFNYDNYKYKLYLILKKIFGKDLSGYILQIMIKENEKSANYNINSYSGLCHHYRYHKPENKDDVFNFRLDCMDSLFNLCGFTETVCKIDLH